MEEKQKEEDKEKKIGMAPEVKDSKSPKEPKLVADKDIDYDEAEKLDSLELRLTSMKEDMPLSEDPEVMHPRCYLRRVCLKCQS